MLWLARSTWLSVFGVGKSLLVGLVGDIGQREWLSYSITSLSSLADKLAETMGGVVCRTYTTCATSEAATTSPASSTATTRAALATLATTSTFAAADRSFRLFTGWFRLASKLNRNLAF